MKPERADRRFDATDLDDVVHGRVRLGIMAYLAGAGAADFVTLKEHLRTTNGNLSVHLGKLEDAGYVELERAIVGKRTSHHGPTDRVGMSGALFSAGLIWGGWAAEGRSARCRDGAGRFLLRRGACQVACGTARDAELQSARF